MRRISPREYERLMRRMGVKMQEVPCEKVVILMSDKELVIEEPKVVVLEVQGERIYQVTGREVEVAREVALEEFSEEDVNLVAEQAGVSVEEARKALQEVGGDLAQAILLLQARKGSVNAGKV